MDSPLAAEATACFRRHLKDLPEATEPAETFLSGPNIRITRSVEESKALNRVTGGMIILSASGMAEAGRIRHHLLNNLWRPEATVLFVGYQAPGTLGRLLLDGAERVSIMGTEVVVRARIRSLDLYSGHADRRGLLAWLEAQGAGGAGHLPRARRGGGARLLRRPGTGRGPTPPLFLPELDAVYALPADGAPEPRRRRAASCAGGGACAVRLAQRAGASPDGTPSPAR
ncbi:MAG: MBL fold metallo-hydrolase RNA specificity domain-containing protein [Acetobacteraceae bacterium]|nr:MBL fold metallo-hydrolase RNA specificity domain-containing protein [Acetobacteraceae bacterium]